MQLEYFFRSKHKMNLNTFNSHKELTGNLDLFLMPMYLQIQAKISQVSGIFEEKVLVYYCLFRLLSSKNFL